VTQAPVSDAARRRALVLLALLTLVWGTNWPLFPVVMREVSVWSFRAISMTGAGLLLLAVARLRGQSLALPRHTWFPVLGGALVYLSIWNIGSALAAVMIPSGQAAILGFTMPVWAALIGWLFFRERLSGRQWLAVALTACGVLLLTWRSLDAYRQAPLGVALALLAAVGWAGGTMIIKRSGVSVPATVLSGWQLLVASVPVTVCALVIDGSSGSWPSLQVMLAIAYITVVPMGVGNVVWFAIVGLLPAHLAGLSTILVPVVAMVSGAIVHGEPLGPLQIVAMVCFASALALALLLPARRAPSATDAG
jgi:drug/metabolite transporter (DMT)-like permease